MNRALPVRINLNRSAIEKIKEFDPANLKSQTDLASVAIAPVDLRQIPIESAIKEAP